MITLREVALEKVREGVTNLKEINKVTFVEYADFQCPACGAAMGATQEAT